MAEKTILIVEDNLVNQKLIMVLLQSQGYALLAAQDGEEAVAVATKNHPDLILMDLQLPKISGYSATQVLKQNPDTADILIIAFTAHMMPGDKQQAQEIGFDGYITKPINIRTFPETIRQYLQPRSSD